MYNEFSIDAVTRRVNKMVSFRNEYENGDLSALHIRISKGNRKTGFAVPSVSLIPVADCAHCETCKSGCYDVRNVCYQETVQRSRAINSAILRKDPARYFDEIAKAVRGFRFFRWHIGGDLVSRSYFLRVVEIAENTPKCDFLIFTKLYGVVNRFIDEGGNIPENLHIVFSDWRGEKMPNPHKIPVSSPVWFDKEGNELERGKNTTAKFYWCPGLCEECAENGSGCFGLKRGETILFKAH